MNFDKKIDKSAKALSKVFKENNLDQIGENVLLTLSELSSKSLKFKQFLSTQRIDIKTKKEILSEVLKNVFNNTEFEITYALIEHIDFNYIDSIYSKFKQINKSTAGRIDVRATTALEISDKDLDALKESIESKTNNKVSIKNIVDKSLLGGIKLKVGNTLIDGSISTRLEKLKQSMINK